MNPRHVSNKRSHIHIVEDIWRYDNDEILSLYYIYIYIYARRTLPRISDRRFISRRRGRRRENSILRRDKITLASCTRALRDSSRLRDNIIVKWQTDFERYGLAGPGARRTVSLQIRTKPGETTTFDRRISSGYDFLFGQYKEHPSEITKLP